MNGLFAADGLKKLVCSGKFAIGVVSGLWAAFMLMMPYPTRAATLLPIVHNNGGDISLQLDSHNIPVIAFIDTTINGTVALVWCNSPTYCDDPAFIPVDASVNATYVTLALDSNDVPAVAYYDQFNKHLLFAHCESSACNSPNIVTVDNADMAGMHPSIVLNGAGNAVIAYNDADDQQLKIAFCADADCTTSTIKILDTNIYTASSISLKLNQAGNPVIAYTDNGLDLALIRCNDAACATTTTRILDSTDQASSPSLQIDSTNVPVVAYYDSGNQNLKLARCTSAGCGASSSIVVDSTGDVGNLPSLALNTNDLAVITYYDHTNGDLDIAYCNDLACAIPNVSYFDFPAGTDSMESSLTLNGDIPIYAFNDPSDNGTILIYNEFNNAPVLNKNVSVEVAAGASLIFSSSVLDSFDVDNVNVGPNPTITYMVTAPPTEGTLSQTTFTQDQIDSGSVNYTYTGLISDQFTFTVSDGTDTSGPFVFSINPSTANAAPRPNYFTTTPFDLTWSPVTYATEYEIEVGTASPITPANRVYSTIVAAPTVSIPVTLPDGVYYWHVHAHNGTLPWGAYGAVQSFMVNT